MAKKLEKDERPVRDKDYVAAVTIRLEKETRDSLQAEADACGTTVSQVIRNLIKQKGQASVIDVSAANAAQKSLLSAQYVRNVFKKIAAEHSEIYAFFKAHSEAGSYSLLQRDIYDLNYLLLEIQKALNIYLSDYRVAESHFAAKSIPAPDPAPACDAKPAKAVPASPSEINPKYHYMIKTIITGDVIDDPKEFSNKSGAKMFCFHVASKTVAAKRIIYEVIAGKDDELMKLITKDIHVVVEGDFDIYSRTINKDGEEKRIDNYRILNPTVNV